MDDRVRWSESLPHSRASRTAALTSWSEVDGDGARHTFARFAKLRPDDVAALRDAFDGPGRPMGVIALATDGDALTVTFDAARTPLALIAALAAAETGPARTTGPAGANDDALTRRAAAALQEPALDTARLIETYLEPMLLESP